MCLTLEFDEVHTKKRPRLGSRTQTRVYDPNAKSTRQTRAGIMKQLKAQNFRVLLASSVELDIQVTIKSAKHLIGKPCKKTPDLDNVVKYYMDAMNGLVYTDDRVVNKIHCQKVNGLLNSVVIKVVGDA